MYSSFSFFICSPSSGEASSPFDIWLNNFLNSLIRIKSKSPVSSNIASLNTVFIDLLFFLKTFLISSFISLNCLSSLIRSLDAFEIIKTANLDINCELFS